MTGDQTVTAWSLLGFRDADGEPIQPYYAAFMLVHGMDRKLVGSQWPFMEWIQGMWRESGLSREPPDHDGFLAWLEERVAVFVEELEEVKA